MHWVSYNPKKYTSAADGVFYIKIDNDSKQILTPKFIELNLSDLHLKTDKNSKDSKSKTKDSDLKFIVYDLLENKYGGVTLVGENYYSTFVSNQNSSSTVHFNRDIILINFSAEGEILWTQQIPKFQKTGDKHLMYANFGVHKHNENIYFIYNDNPNNANLSGNDKVKTFQRMTRNAITMIVEVDENGAKNKQVLSTYDDINVYLTPAKITTLQNNEFIIKGGSTFDFKLVKVGFK